MTTDIVTSDMITDSESGRRVIPQNSKDEFTEQEIVDILFSLQELEKAYPDYLFTFGAGEELAIVWQKRPEHSWREVSFSFKSWIECRCGYKPERQEDMDAHIPQVTT